MNTSQNWRGYALSCELETAVKLKEELIKNRRHLHQHPELAYEEIETARFVREKLQDMGINEIKTLAGTGVVAMIRGFTPGPTIMLRADMDGLPIHDQKNVTYASKVPGKAHLCGHDAHTAMLLGAARLLSQHPLPVGNVKLVFQPAEEGNAGARKMIEEGVLLDPPVDFAAGLHVCPDTSVGKLTVCPDACMAFSDTFKIKVIGKGGHAGRPHLTVDSIAVAAQVISALQQVVSRQTDPLSPAVITIGKITGGNVRNVIASSVEMEGTVRTFEQSTRIQIKEKIESITKGLCDGMGATYDYEYIEGYPVLVNSAKHIPLLRKTAEELLDEQALSISSPVTLGEDFAYYAEKVPSLFFWLGVRNEEKGIVHQHHHPLFDLDEESLPIGAAVLARFALNYLSC